MWARGWGTPSHWAQHLCPQSACQSNVGLWPWCVEGRGCQPLWVEGCQAFLHHVIHPAQAAVNGQNLTVSGRLPSICAHPPLGGGLCVPRASTVTTSRGRSRQTLGVCSVSSPGAHSPGFLPRRETDRITVRSAGPWGLVCPRLTFFYDALSQARPCTPLVKQLTPALPPHCS